MKMKSKKRVRMGRQASRKLFTRTARKTNKRNIMDRPMRGGIRL